MTNPANDILKQAQQGSVAAIIQILNEKLADSGVRTRAILADSVLQLLCEAATLDQLDQPILVEQIRQILEGISPRGIRRVKINSRIVREQQLLWLEEINRDPVNQLLWSEEITLRQPNFLQRVSSDWKNRAQDPNKAAYQTRSARQIREDRQFWRGLTGGALISVLLLAGGWFVYSRFSNASAPTTEAKAPEPETSPNPTVTSAATTPGSKPANGSPSPAVAKGDPFADAVRLAEQTSQAGKAAKSPAQWLDLAARWQQASDLMATVPATDQRYQTAQDRVNAYRQNSEAALQEAQKLRAASPQTSTPGTPPGNTQ